MDVIFPHWEGVVRILFGLIHTKIFLFTFCNIGNGFLSFRFQIIITEPDNPLETWDYDLDIILWSV